MPRQVSWTLKYYHAQEYCCGGEIFLMCRLCQPAAPAADTVEEAERVAEQFGCSKYGWPGSGRSPASLSKHLLAIHGITCRGPLHGAPAHGQAETAHGTPAHDTPGPAGLHCREPGMRGCRS